MKRHGHNAPLRKAKGKDADTSQCQRGLVVSTHGRHVIVEDEQGQRLICHPRGKKSEAVVGDRVLWQPTLEGSGEGLIVQVEERRNLLYRQDEWRSKSFAANLDQMLVWIAVEPVFSEAQLTRALLAARDSPAESSTTRVRSVLTLAPAPFSGLLAGVRSASGTRRGLVTGGAW